MGLLIDIIDTSGEPDILSAIIDKTMKDKPLIQLNGWQTIKQYADRKGTTPNVVSVWVQRDKVQHLKFPELNNLVLVKDITESNAAPL